MSKSLDSVSPMRRPSEQPDGLENDSGVPARADAELSNHDDPWPATADSELDLPAASSTIAPESDGASLELPSQQPSAVARAWSPHLPMIERGYYRMHGELARGGLGRVSHARDRRLGRDVAIKELLHEQRGHARFLREALITSRLQHPAIVPVYEAGYWPDGAPFYAMKLVSGATLGERVRGAGSMEERLAYLSNVVAVANAVAYAHSRRIIHRDLKPENIILGPFGETMVVDWGLAKELDAAETERGPVEELRPDIDHLTRAGAILGTPMYMAPEQAESATVDERADIYALGAIVYFVIAGRAPYEDGATPGDVVAKVRAEAPVPLAERAPEAPPELLAIVERAMARDPAERYLSAKHLAEDLQRFLDGQLVSAHRYSLRSLIGRWLARHRALVAVTAVLLLALLGTAAFSVSRVVAERNRARARYLELIVAQAALERDPTATVAWLATLPEGAGNWPEARLVATEARNRGIARHVWREQGGTVNDIELSSDQRYLAAANLDGTVWLIDRERGTTQILSGHGGWVYSVAFSPTQPHVVSAGEDRTLRIWDVSGALLEVFDDHPSPVRQARFSSDGRYLASGDAAGRVLVRDLESGEVRISSDGGAEVWRLAFSPDGAWLVVGDERGGLRCWPASAWTDQPSRPESGQAPAVVERAPEPAYFRGHTGAIESIHFSPDSRRIASAGQDRSARVWDASSGELLAVHEHESSVEKVRFAGRGEVLVTSTNDGQVLVWDAGEPRLVTRHKHAAYTLEVSRDGRFLASGGGAGTVHVWDVMSARTLRTYEGAEDLITDMAFSRDGATLWSAGRTSGIREWDLSAKGKQEKMGARGQVHALAMTPDHRYLASGHGYGGVLLWDTAMDRAQVVSQHGDSVVDHVAFTSDGSHLLSASLDGSVLVHDMAARATRSLGAHADRITSLARAPRGRLFATSSHDRTIRLWDLADPTPGGRVLVGHEDRVHQVDVSPDGEMLVSASSDGTVRLWQVGSGRGQILGQHPGGARTVAWSPGGAHVASGGDDHRVVLWSWATDDARVLEGHERPIARVAFSPDGQYLASFGDNGSHVFVWPVSGGDPTTVDVSDPITMAWSADSRRLAVVGEEPAVYLWDVAAGKGRVLTRLPTAANALIYAPGGDIIAFGDRRQTIHLWRDDLPTDERGFRAWLRAATTAEISTSTFLATPTRHLEPPLAWRD